MEKHKQNVNYNYIRSKQLHEAWDMIDILRPLPSTASGGCCCALDIDTNVLTEPCPCKAEVACE